MSTQGVNLNSPLTYLPPVKTNAAAAATGTTSTTGSTGTGAGLTSTVTGTTFLNLLVKELQNQDPSAPMDSTAMVGQMISLNQLDQLISINQTIGGSTSSTASGSTASGQAAAAISGASAATSSQPSAQVMAARAAIESAANPANSLNPAALAAGNPNTTLDLSNFTNQIGSK